jgi:hypothetical protein
MRCGGGVEVERGEREREEDLLPQFERQHQRHIPTKQARSEDGSLYLPT